MSELNKFIIIDADTNLSEDLDTYLRKDSITNKQTDYNVVSIIGSQSSGKSTLLNSLFDTSFEVLDAKKDGKKRTTRGVWGSVDKNNSIIILDVEGSDSQERGEDGKNYQNKTALFALCLSQVFIINIWSTQIGNYVGSQFEIIRVILELNLKYFVKEGVKKQIVYVFRDHSEDDNLEANIKTIIDGISEAWKSIQGHQKHDFSQLFDVKFHPLSNYRYEKSKFDADIKTLKQKFINKESQDYLIDEDQYNINLPISALPSYIKQIWSTVQSDKLVNLPSQKTMIANQRCDEIKLECLLKSKIQLEEFNQKLQRKQVNKFGFEMENIYSDILKYYENEALYYQKDVVTQKRDELLNDLLSSGYPIFQDHLVQLKKQQKSLFESKMNDLSEIQSDNLKRVMQELEQIEGEILSQINREIQKCQVFEANWNIPKIIMEFQENIYDIEKQKIHELCLSFLAKKKSQVTQQLEVKINSLYRRLNFDFWVSINKQLEKLIYSQEDEMSATFKQYMKMDLQQSKSLINNFFGEIIANVYSFIQNKNDDLEQYLLDHFKLIFFRDDNEIAYNWEKKSLQEIEIIYQNAKLNNDQLFTELFCKNLLDDRITKNKPKALLNEDQLEKKKILLKKEREDQYQEAIRKHNEGNKNQIPFPFLMLFAYFAYDDLFRMISNVWFFYPILYLGCFVLFSYAIGHGDLPLIIMNKIIKEFNSRFGHIMWGNFIKMKFQ